MHLCYSFEDNFSLLEAWKFMSRGADASLYLVGAASLMQHVVASPLSSNKHNSEIQKAIIYEPGPLQSCRFLLIKAGTLFFNRQCSSFKCNLMEFSIYLPCNPVVSWSAITANTIWDCLYRMSPAVHKKSKVTTQVKKNGRNAAGNF